MNEDDFVNSILQAAFDRAAARERGSDRKREKAARAPEVALKIDVDFD
jgi:hypothetical protein